jgi:NAD(P)-dependent dehydrogenase (short-subunit alcohol dehydrogenase family)
MAAEIQATAIANRFDGKVAVVTGGASGIGLGIARRFLAEGGSVVAGDRSADVLVELEKELGERFLGVSTDVRKEEDVENLLAKAVERFGAVNAGFNAAGEGEGSEVINQDAAMWKRQIDVLLNGVFHAVKHEAKQMVAQGTGGAIVNISSINGQVAAPEASAYCAAKAGVEMLTNTTALELGDRGVRVTAIEPGLINTPMAARLGHMTPEIVAKWMEHTPLDRVGQPADIAAAALFLASDEASWITGTRLVVDGGLINTAYPKVGETFAE